jgi:Carbohydrate binding domain
MQRFPKHLAEPRGYPGLARNSVLVEGLGALLAVALAATLVVAFVVERPGSGGAGRRARSAAPATAQRPVPPGPAPTTPPNGVPATRPGAAPGPGRPPEAGGLLADPGFEAGLGGWRPLGGARLERVDQPRGGSFAAAVTTGASPDPGMTATGVTRCAPHRSYQASAWVRASVPGATVAFNLLEYVHGRRFAVDTVGAVLGGTGWQRIEVDHFTHVPKAKLAVEIVAPGLPLGSSVLVDDLALRVAATKQTFTTTS